jgi:putative lipoprotein
VNQILGLCLATNLVFAQTAVVRDSWFGIDKIKHFFISAFVESITYSALQAANVKRRPALAGAIGVTAAVGVARELHDRKKPGNRFSYKDLTWDALGIGAGTVMLTNTTK